MLPTSSRRRDGELGDLNFEANGRWAKVKFWWKDADVRRDVIYDLQAEDEVVVVDDDERDELRHRDP